MSLELWDTQRGNLLGEYASDEAALAAVLALHEARGDAFVISLILAVEHPSGDTEIVATGSALLRAIAGSTTSSKRLVTA
jgi:hypothetical protein